MKKMFILVTIFLCSCTGDTGPEGPVGPQGPPGPKGGGDIKVVEFSFTFGQMSLDTGLTPEVYRYTFSSVISQITQDVFDNGAVIAYSEVNDGLGWRALPFLSDVDTDDDSKVDFSFNMNYGYAVGSIVINIEFSTTGIEFEDSYTFRIKVVIIPGNSNNYIAKLILWFL